MRAFIAYAREKGDPEQFLARLDHISFSRIGKGEADEAESVPIMTAFRAKGLQWPVVFVPDCNQGTFPYRAEAGIEEERRLFYVAITRPQEHLHLHFGQGAPLSQFLQEADWERTMADVESLGTALEREPSQWRTQDALAVARQTTALGLERYFQAWWGALADRMREIAGTVQRLLDAARSRGLDGHLGLTDGQRNFWAMFGPPSQAPAGGEFPDLAAFVPTPAPPLPATAMPGPVGGGAPDAPPRFAAGGRVWQEQYGGGTVAAVSSPPSNPTVDVVWDAGGRSRLIARAAGLRPA